MCTWYCRAQRLLCARSASSLDKLNGGDVIFPFREMLSFSICAIETSSLAIFGSPVQDLGAFWKSAWNEMVLLTTFFPTDHLVVAWEQDCSASTPITTADWVITVHIPPHGMLTLMLSVWRADIWVFSNGKIFFIYQLVYKLLGWYVNYDTKIY